MTIKDHYDKARTWQRKCIIISFYHNGMLLKKKNKWNVRLTGHYFGISFGKVSEDLKLSEKLDQVKQFKTRQLALDWLRHSNGK